MIMNFRDDTESDNLNWFLEEFKKADFKVYTKTIAYWEGHINEDEYANN